MGAHLKLILVLSIAVLIGLAAYVIAKPTLLGSVESERVTELSDIEARAQAAKKKQINSNEGSGPDARIAADLLKPNLPTKGPLNTAELKHIKLTDQDGQAFSLDDLKGETVLINFMFAGCTSICPVQTVGLRRVHNEMQLDPEKDRIKLVSISIAPLSDTPEQLKEFAQRFDIDKPSWRFARTSQINTDELTKQFSVGVKPLGEGQLDHRSLLYLINHEGVMIQQYRGNVVDVDRLKTELRVVDQLGR